MDIQFSEAECVNIDAENRKIYCRSSIPNNLNEKEEFVVDYDYLIISVGANVNTFNTPGVAENCHFLKVNYFTYAVIFLDDVIAYKILFSFGGPGGGGGGKIYRIQEKLLWVINVR